MMKTTSIFVYGTLTSPEVVRVLLGRELAAIRPAWLEGYTRHPVQNFVFPSMIPCVGKSVEGCIYTDVSPLEQKVLDWYEGHRTPGMPNPFCPCTTHLFIILSR
jgi:gamma-glutamylcyclotransferase (GGCT)/AIG2-like uncharacterized protein YtfP